MQMTPPDDFAGQFVLGRDPVSLEGGQDVALASLYLQVAPPCGITRVETADGVLLGVLLGRPIDLDAAATLEGALIVPEPAPGEVDGWVEAHIYRLGGSFLFILDFGGMRRVYLDACGSRSAVYDPETGRSGATAFALLEVAEVQTRFDQALYEHLDVDREGWFPGDLTAHNGIMRLLPNHYLDMDNMDARRHWPMGQVHSDMAPEALCGEISRAAQATIGAVLAHGRGSVGLTAGTETRFLAAQSRAYLDRLSFVTVRAEGAERDVWAAGKLARTFGLEHSYLPVVRGDEANARDWQARAGYCVGGAHRYTRRSIEPLRVREFFIGGQAGEVGRGFFWRPEDRAETPVDAASIEARLGMPAHQKVTGALTRWRAGLDGFDAYTILDLAYIELRMGSWAFAGSYCDPAPEDVFPMISRRSFAAMMALPADWRHDKEKMIRVSISQVWPELLALPFNSYGDFRDQLMTVKRAVKNPHLIAKKLRKKFGG